MVKIPRIRGPLTFILLPLAIIAGAGAWAERSGWLYVWLPQLAPPAITLGEDQAVTLIRISDGDTVVVRYHDLSLPLRLLNVNTEESVHRDKSKNTAFGKITSEWAKSYLKGQQVRVEFKRDGWKISTDHYGRALAFLWIERGEPGWDDDENYNETLIREGYSPYVTDFGPAGVYHQRFIEAETTAKQANKGIWGR